VKIFSSRVIQGLKAMAKRTNSLPVKNFRKDADDWIGDCLDDNGSPYFKRHDGKEAIGICRNGQNTPTTLFIDASRKDVSRSIRQDGWRWPSRKYGDKPKGVQSIIFQREDGWTEGKAQKWLKGHGYQYKDMDTEREKDAIRFRQKDPGEFLRCRRNNDKFGKGVDVIFCFN